jgi:hypothetical protein
MTAGTAMPTMAVGAVSTSMPMSISVVGEAMLMSMDGVESMAVADDEPSNLVGVARSGKVGEGAGEFVDPDPVVSSGRYRAAPIHLAGRGGEEVEKSVPVVVGRGRGLRELPEIRLSAASSPRRQLVAAAIQGQKDGHAVLDASFCASSFLCVRIFGSVSAASMPPAQPSGFLPGWDWGGAAGMLQAAGGTSGSDCVLVVFVRVFAVKVRGHVVISAFFGPLCKTSPTVGMNFWVLPDRSVQKKKDPIDNVDRERSRPFL